MKYLFITFSILCLLSCNGSESGRDVPSDPENPSGFDRKEMLTHWANNIIIPAYDQLYNDNTVLDDRVKDFVKGPSVANLEEARVAFKEAYITWQKAAFFEVGPAKNENLRQYFNIYPTNPAGIEALSKEADYKLHLVSNSAMQGYPAVDYLLNGIGSENASIIAEYTTGNNAQNYKNYLLALTARLKEKSKMVKTDWSNYKSSFINNDGSSATSSVDLIANDYLLYYEKFYRNGKVRLPVGYSTGNALPKNVEAYYSPELSKTLFNTATTALHDFFKGKNYGGNTSGLGFESYLNALKGQDIAADINNGFSEITKASNALNGTMKEAVINDRTAVLKLHDQIQTNLVPLKVDMLQKFNISVVYSDGDGD